MPMLSAVAWFLAVAVFVGWAYWVVAWVRAGIAARPEHSIRSALEFPEPAEGWPSVSIVVPVHNEERSIERCVTSLRAQTLERIEFVFVLDRCIDGSREILERHAAEDSRIVLVENDSCPAGWAGKCYAARLGAERATGDRIIFTDADTWFDPNLVRAAVAMAAHRGLQLLSLLGTLETRHWFERIVQPVAAMTLLRMYPIERVNRIERHRPFANGQFMLFERAWYDRIGGHEAVKDHLLEDIAFARLVYHREGGRVGLFLADDLLTCSMYDTFDQLKAGWQRIYIEASRRRPKKLRKSARQVIGLGVAFPIIQLVTLVVAIVVISSGGVRLGVASVALVFMAVGTQAAALLRIYSLSHAPLSMVLLFPLGSWIVGRIFFDAARDLENRVPVAWAGRDYPLDPL